MDRPLTITALTYADLYHVYPVGERDLEVLRYTLSALRLDIHGLTVSDGREPGYTGAYSRVSVTYRQAETIVDVLLTDAYDAATAATAIGSGYTVRDARWAVRQALVETFGERLGGLIMDALLIGGESPHSTHVGGTPAY